MNDYASLLGSIGTVLGLVRACPQLFRLLRAREAYGVSLDAAATGAIVSFSWSAYGFLTHQIYVGISSGSTGIIFTLIAIFALRFGRSMKEFRVAPLWLGILLLTGGVFGKNGLGIILPISVLASNLPQLWVAFKEGNLADLSLGTWALSVTDGLIWFTYALIQHDFSIIGYGLFQFTTSGLIVLLKSMHLLKARNHKPIPDLHETGG
jgi:uncharacterized protein with PQ loop repeat